MRPVHCTCTSLLLVAIIILTQLLFGMGIRELFCLTNKLSQSDTSISEESVWYRQLSLK